jgi:hypothetical protein
MARITPIAFISSTKEDLEPYRSAARDAAIQAGFHPEMMEYFPARGEWPPYQACMEKVAPCDVLVVIVADRYGWVPADQPGPKAKRFKSITWLECERARKEKKEILAFIVDDKHKWPPELDETYRLTKAIKEGTFTPDLAEEVNRNVARLKEFKKWLNGLGVRATFANSDELERKVHAALTAWRDSNLKSQATVVKPKAAKADPAKYLKWLREHTAWISIRGLQVGSGKAHRFPIEDLYIPLKTVEAPEEQVSKKGRQRCRRTWEDRQRCRWNTLCDIAGW